MDSSVWITLALTLKVAGCATAINLVLGVAVGWLLARRRFFGREFVDAVLSWTSDDTTVRLPRTPVQPMAAADVAQAVAEVCAGAPLRGTRNVAGPEVFALDELGRITLAAEGDRRTVVPDDTAGMFAAAPGDALIAPADAVIAKTSYREWLAAR